MDYRTGVRGRVLIGLGAAMLLFSAENAHTAYQSPSTLITQFSSLLGANRNALLVWQREAGSDMPTNGGSTVNEIMKMDTRDGIPVVLVAKINGHKSDPTFTWDGKRVVYYNDNTSEVRIVNWNGTNDRLVIKGYNGSGHCWRSSNGKDYVLACNMTGDPDAANSIGRKLYRINVDDTTDKVVILTTTWTATQAEEGNVGTHWVSMSADGKYVTGGFPTYSNIGAAVLNSSGQSASFIRTFTNAQGCWPTMARDNTGDILMTVGDHTQVVIIGYNDVQKSTWDCPVSILGSATGMYECLRWTPDRNFLTLIRCCGANKPGPYLVRMSDKQFVYLNASLIQGEGNMDVFFYTPSQAQSRPVQALGRQSSRIEPTGQIYDCRGAIAARAGSAGVYFTPTHAGGVRALVKGSGSPLGGD